MRFTEAADGSHLKGAMIALMPSTEDAWGLAIDGYEKAENLHTTLYFLGDNESFDESSRRYLAKSVSDAVSEHALRRVGARVFGVAHWNADGPDPVWVWQVGGDPARDTKALAATKEVVDFAVRYAVRCGTLDPRLLPEQHSPWAAHIAAAYSEDPRLLGTMQRRLGVITYDRIRVSFGGIHEDIPLMLAP